MIQKILDTTMLYSLKVMVIVIGFMLVYPAFRHQVLIFADFWDLKDLKSFDCSDHIK